MQRLNKEYKLNFNDSIKLIYGSVDRLNPKVIYINGKTWIKPEFNGDYKTSIDLIISDFKKRVRNNIFKTNMFSNKYICDFDLNTMNISENKKTFMTFDIFIKQDKNPILDLKSIKPYVNDAFTNLINDLVKEFKENSFVLSISKQN